MQKSGISSVNSLQSMQQCTATLGLFKYANYASTGGNSLQNSAPSKVADWVKAKGGHTVITKASICIALHIAICFSFPLPLFLLR
jgi:hypothetical protein